VLLLQAVLVLLSSSCSCSLIDRWCLADCERPRIKATEHHVFGTKRPRISLVYELRSPPVRASSKLLLLVHVLSLLQSCC
jgi:hypothetical protein